MQALQQKTQPQLIRNQITSICPAEDPEFREDLVEKEPSTTQKESEETGDQVAWSEPQPLI